MKLLLGLFGLLIACDFANAESETAILLNKIEAAFPEDYRNAVSIVERRSSAMAQKIESFDLLQKNFEKAWTEDLRSIDTVAPSDNTKAIFFKAAQILPRKDYINFLMTTCQLVQNGKISKQQLKWGLFPSEKHLREMWIENPPSVPLKDLAHQASLIFADDEGMKDFLDKVVSGQVAIDGIGKDEKSLSATPEASQKPPAAVQRPDRQPSESPAVKTPTPNERTRDSSAAGSFVQKIGEGTILTFAGIIGIIIAAMLFWHWRSKTSQ